MNEDITIGNVTRHKNLVVAPVYGSNSFTEQVLLLERALQTGNFTITGSTVNSMDVVNDLSDKVLVVGGSTIERHGGQKRYAKFPTLVMPNSRISLPVNCAEQGQPSIRGDYGGHTTIVPPSLRSGDVDQNTAWSRINNTQLILGRMNPTRSYCFTDRTADVDDYLDAIGKRPREGQVGIIAGIKSGDKTYFYTDFFGNHSILADTYSKLAKCFGIVARVHEGNADDIKLDDLVGFFRKFEVAEGHREPHVGGGELYLLKNQEDGAVLTGTVLSYKTAPVQVTMREKVGQD